MERSMPITGDQHHQEMRAWIESLEGAVKKLRDGKLTVSFGQRAERLEYTDILRVIHELSAKSKSARSCRAALIEAVVSAEKKIPGSSYFVVCGFISSYLGGQTESLQELGESSKFMDIDELNDVVSKVTSCTVTNTVVRQALAAAGSSGTIRVKRSDEFDIRIKVHEGYRFGAGVDPRFCQGAGQKNFDFLDCDVAAIDGVVTTVSEINHLLESYSQTRRRLILFARGFEPEVIHTLAVNYLRGSLRVIPHNVPTSLDTINLIRDLCVCIGHSAISPLKGDLISSIKIEDIPSVRRIISSQSECTIENPDRALDVWNHARWLLDQAASEQVEDKRKLFEDRAANLNPAVVEIWLGRSLGEMAGVIEDRIRSALGIVNGFCLTGRISLGDINSSALSFGLLPKIEVLPAGSLINGMKIGTGLAESMKAIGAVIADDTR
jgi:chaperonin GroEL (HSP60 family)